MLLTDPADKNKPQSDLRLRFGNPLPERYQRALVTLPERMQRVHTFMLLTVP